MGWDLVVLSDRPPCGDIDIQEEGQGWIARGVLIFADLAVGI